MNLFQDDNQVLVDLFRLIKQRKLQRPVGSYTAYLFNSGLDKILKKIGEESTEVVLAVKNNDRENIVYECADLIYHLLVLLAEQEIDPAEILQELKRRAK